MNSDAPVGNDEIVYRRAVERWVTFGDVPRIELDVFLPHKTEDNDGLSLSRAKSQEHPEFLDAPEFIVLSKKGKRYFALALSAGVLRRQELEVVPDPEASNPGHALIPTLNSTLRATEKVRCREIADALARLVEQIPESILGPYEGQTEFPAQ